MTNWESLGLLEVHHGRGRDGFRCPQHRSGLEGEEDGHEHATRVSSSRAVEEPEKKLIVYYL